MSVTIEASDLKVAAQWAARLLVTHPAAPVMGAAVLVAGEAGLTVSSYNYESFGTITVPAGIGSELDSALVPGRLLADLAGRLTGEVTLTLNGDILTLEGARNTFKIRTMIAADYPSIPSRPPAVGFVDGDQLAGLVAAIGSTVADPASATDQNLHAVRLETDGKTLTAWATDRYKAGRVRIPWTGPADLSVVIPWITLKTAAAGLSGRVDVGILGAQFELGTKDRTITVMALAGKFPTILPKLIVEHSPGHTAVVDRAQLIDAVAAAVAVTERGIPTDLTFAANPAVTVTAGGDLSEYSGVIEGTWDGVEGHAVAMDPAYLVAVLNALPGERVQLSVSDAAKDPVVFREAVPDSPPNDEVFLLVMPHRKAV